MMIAYKNEADNSLESNKQPTLVLLMPHTSFRLLIYHLGH